MLTCLWEVFALFFDANTPSEVSFFTIILIQLEAVIWGMFLFSVHQESSQFGFTKCKDVEHFGRDLWLFRSVLHMLWSFCLWQVVVCCYRVSFVNLYPCVLLFTLLVACFRTQPKNIYFSTASQYFRIEWQKDEGKVQICWICSCVCMNDKNRSEQGLPLKRGEDNFHVKRASAHSEKMLR